MPASQSQLERRQKVQRVLDAVRPQEAVDVVVAVVAAVLALDGVHASQVKPKLPMPRLLLKATAQPTFLAKSSL